MRPRIGPGARKKIRFILIVSENLNFFSISQQIETKTLRACKICRTPTPYPANMNKQQNFAYFILVHLQTVWKCYGMKKCIVIRGFFFSIFTGWRFAHQGEPIATEGRTCHFTFLSTLTFQFCIRVDCLYTNWTAYELIYVLLHCKAYYWIISMFFFLYLYLFLLNALNPLRSN